MKESKKLLAGSVFALLATIIWSGNFIVARGVSQEFPPVMLALCRWTTALLALLPFALRPFLRELQAVRRHLPFLFVAAITGVTVFNTLIYIAGRHTTALNLSLIATFTPVFVILLARVFLGEAITPRMAIGLLASIFGVVTLVTGGDYALLAQLQFNRGDLLMLSATLVFAIYTIYVRRKPEDISAPTFLFATFGLGVLMLIPWAAWEWTNGATAHFSPHILGIIAYIGIGASLISYYCWNQAVAMAGAARSGMIYYTLPVFCGLEAFLILNEHLGMIHAASGLLIIGGIVTATRR